MDAKEEILKIQDDFGFTAEGMSKLMEISPRVYRNKKSDKVLEHSFNPENYRKLVKNLVNKIKALEEKITNFPV